jgi:hypothetical protein
MADPETLKAYDSTADLVKQILTLSTGIIALTVTFLKDVVGSSAARAGWAIRLSWISFLFAIVFGLWTLAAIAGSISRQPTASVYGSNITIPLSFQFGAFGLGIVSVLIFGWASLDARLRKRPQERIRVVTVVRNRPAVNSGRPWHRKP